MVNENDPVERGSLPGKASVTSARILLQTYLTLFLTRFIACWMLEYSGIPCIYALCHKQQVVRSVSEIIILQILTPAVPEKSGDIDSEWVLHAQPFTSLAISQVDLIAGAGTFLDTLELVIVYAET